MFNKFLTGLVLTSSLALTTTSFAQTNSSTKKKQSKTTSKTVKKTDAQLKAEAEKKAQEEAKAKAEAEANAKAEAEKAAKAKDEEEAKNATVAQKTLKFVKDRFTLSYYGEYYSARDAENELESINMIHTPSLTYKVADNWKFKASGDFRMNTRGESTGTYPNQYYRALYSITRENILTESEHGIKLNVGVARRQFSQHVTATTYGNWRITAEVNKALSSRVNLNVYSLYLFNDYKKAAIGNKNTYKHALEFIPVLTVQLTDKLSFMAYDDFTVNFAKYRGQGQNFYWLHDLTPAMFTYQYNDVHSTYLQFKYFHNTGGQAYSKTGRDRTDIYSAYIGHTLQVTPKISITPEVGSTLFQSKDGRNGLSQNAKYVYLALYISARL